MGKYEDWLAKKEVPKKMSILELGVLAKKLGVDTDSIDEKHMDALHDELLEAVKAKGITVES